MQPTNSKSTNPQTTTSTMSWVQMSGAGGSAALGASRLQNTASGNANSNNMNQTGGQGKHQDSPFRASDSTASSSSASSSPYGSSSSPANSNSAQQQQQQHRLAFDDSSSNHMSSARSSLLSSSNSGPNSFAPSITASGDYLASSSSQHQHQEQQQRQQQIDEELVKQQQEEENRKLRLQLYVFVLRCISYSFNAKLTGLSEHLHHRQQLPKLRRPQLEQIVQLHTKFVQNPTSFTSARCPHQSLAGVSKAFSVQQQRQLDDLYERSHQIFNAKFLQNERMRLLVEAECCGQQDLRELFRRNADQLLKESNLFSSPSDQHHRQQQRPSHQSTPSTNSSQLKGSFRKSSSHAQHQQQESPAAAARLSSSISISPVQRETILNSWMIKFESIMREEAPGGGGASGETELLSGGSSCNPLITSSGGSGAASTTASTSTTPAPSTPSAMAASSGQLLQQPPKISKEQLYQMFQNILSIKKFEHQLLYNALQLDSADEQAAAIRRELDGRIARIVELERNKKLMPKFVLKEMESLYLEETRMSVNKLMVNLDSLPVTKGGSHANLGAVVAAGGASPAQTHLANSAGSSSSSLLVGGGGGAGGLGLGLGSGGTQTGGSGNESRGVSYGLQKFRRYNSR